MSDLINARKPKLSGRVPALSPANGSMGASGLPPLPPRRSGLPADSAEEPELSVDELHLLRRMLEGRRSELLTSIEQRRGQERDTGREVGDEMDDASAEGVTSMASTLLEREARLLSDVNRALAKMSEGRYGTCEGTGEPIGFSRLRLRPWARFSVGYQEELERAQRERGGV
jgi:DnaK suppressor protein